MQNRTVVSAALMLAALAGSVRADIRSWASSTGGSYSSASNWQPAGVPGADDNLIFDMPGTNSFVCDALVPVTGIQQWRSGTMNWSTTSPHTVAVRFDVATLTGNVGTLRVTSGEMIAAGFLRIGVGSNAFGTLAVDGPAALVTCPEGGQTMIGSPIARGVLNVVSGGSFVSSRPLGLISGSQLGSRIIVDGVGSNITLLGATSDLLVMAQTSFTSEVIVQNGGTITTDGSVLLGSAPTRPGRLRVGDTLATQQSTLTIAGDLRLGETLTTQPGSFGSADFLRGSMVNVAGDLYLGDPNLGPVCTMTINQTLGGPFAVSCRDFHLGPNGVLALDNGRFNVNRDLIVPTGNFVLDTPSATGTGYLVLSGNANLATLRAATAHHATMVVNGTVAVSSDMSIGETAGSLGIVGFQNGAILAVGGVMEVGRSGSGEFDCLGASLASLNELQIGSGAGGSGNVLIQFSTVSCGQASIGVPSGGSDGVLNGGAAANYSCAGSTVVNPGGTINWAGDSYVSGRTIMSGGTLNAAGVIGGRIGGGSGVIVANQDLTLGDAGVPEGYDTGAMLVVGGHVVTVLDRDHAIGSATLAGGEIDAANGWEVPAGGSLEGFGTLGECVALGRMLPTSTGLVFEGQATTSGGIDGTSVAFNRGLIAEGALNARVFTAPGTITVITGPTTIGDGTSLGADLHGTLVTSDDALILSDDDGVGGDDFSLTLGFGTMFVDSVVRIDPGASLRGVGFVDTPRLAVGGDIYPGAHDGDDVGTINTSGLLRPSGRFAHYHIDLGGAGEGQADAVFAGGGIVLSGGSEGATLTVREINGYVPAAGDRIQILGGPIIDGEFEVVNAPVGWTVEYEPNGVFLRYGCESDFTGDGAVDGDDVIAFFEAWDSGAIEGDVTGDGSTDGDDVIFFFGHWDAGC